MTVLNDADLIGLPVRLVVSARTEKEAQLCDKKKALEYLAEYLP